MRRKAPEEDREFLQNNVAYEASENDLITKYTGKWVAFEKGQLIGADDTIAELRALMSDVGHRLIVRVGEVPPRRKYIGGSSIRRTESQHGTMLKTSSTTRLP